MRATLARIRPARRRAFILHNVAAQRFQGGVAASVARSALRDRGLPLRQRLERMGRGRHLERDVGSGADGWTLFATGSERGTPPDGGG